MSFYYCYNYKCTKKKLFGGVEHELFSGSLGSILLEISRIEHLTKQKVDLMNKKRKKGGNEKKKKKKK